MIDPNDKSKLWEYIACVVFAAFAGAMGYINRAADNGDDVSTRALLIQTLSAAFTGCLVLLICMHYQFDMIVTGIMTGLSGWMGASATLGLIMSKVRSNLGLSDDASASKGGNKNGD